nr:lysozyme [Coleofasciculus sp. FACHB-129]
MIKSFEGFELKAYQCPASKWTIGYGHTGTVKSGMKITEAQAEQRLKRELKKFEIAVENALKTSVNDNQFSALVSFTFNLGSDNLRRSTLLQLLNNGKTQQAADEFLKWNQAGRQVLKGLTFRRQAERALFLGEDWRPFRDDNG